MADSLRELGSTRQRMLRQMLQAPAGTDVETLCMRLRISHNAVRQHLTALCSRGWAERCESRATGGRPQARFRLTAAGRELFPRNYAQISAALIDSVVERLGAQSAAELLVDLGRQLGAAETLSGPDASEVAGRLADRMDALGYEAVATGAGGEPQVEAFNCVFHALARRNPAVCKFDLAFMEAASGRRIHHMECIVRGGAVCRFRIGEPLAPP